MAQKITLRFKVFLTNEAVTEVRRFSIEHHILPSDQELVKVLKDVFPILQSCYFTVAWKGK
jgi:hypothetical protein